ncbi:MAG: glucose-1-phosphate cytidylyltransferase [Candidatus Aceula meridiana]|nr:glucose-1-phosphate cytidylyltransferase [Candidatus Aceula meridiana]
MKVVILAGGMGTRICEETEKIPKPMVTIGGKPILWHIMKMYSFYGYNDFIICLGYKGSIIKEYFANYFLYQSNITIDLSNNQIKVHNNTSEPWKVTLIDTGLEAMTGGRIRRIKEYTQGEAFMLTYGDGVSDIDISKVLNFHKSHKKAVTTTAVQLDSRFGKLDLSSDQRVLQFLEKPKKESGWINAGFMICEPKVFDYIPQNDDVVFELGPLKKMAEDGELYAYKHDGFWQCMDTLRDKIQLDKLWDENKSFWKVWKDDAV